MQSRVSMSWAKVSLQLVVACLVGLLGWWTHQQALLTQQAPSRELDGVEYLPKVEHVRALSLGHSPAAADLFWIRAVLYFSRELQAQSDFAWLFAYTRIVISLDPDFEDIYNWAGSVIVIRSPEPTMDQVRAANQILAEGAERFPDNYRLPMSAGSNCQFFARGETEADKEELRQCARRFFTMAATRPDAPPYMASLASQFQDPVEQCRFLKEVYLREHKNEEARHQIESRLKDTACDRVSTEQALVYEEQFEVLRKQGPPYVGGDLWTQLGPLMEWELELLQGKEKVDDGQEGER